MSKNYSFNNFFASGSNLAAKNIVQKHIATSKNTPTILSIRGKAGMGKSHLLLAIENQLVTEKLDTNFLYIDSVELVSKYMFAEKDSSLIGFRKKLISLDFLLVDTVKFLEQHRPCQEILLFIISELAKRNSKIVLAHSDIIKDEHGFIEQLAKRFVTQEVNLSELNYLDRVALLNSLVNMRRIVTSTEAIKYLAHQTGNPRILEHLFNRVVNNAKYLGTQLDLSFIKSVLDYVR
ncbi:MAG: ATP-binding protein [Gammaproteobacteria bacterium]|nr:ATP-binding protein [Gammaproteobacteria bacterium]